MAVQHHIGSRALAVLLPAGWQLNGPAYRGLAEAVTSLILDGRLALDTRLPSERDLANALGISRATVTAAYDQLRGEGFLASRTGSGSYVSLPQTAQPRTSIARWTSANEPADLIDLSCASLPAPRDHLMAAVAEATSRLPAHARDSGYNPMGLLELRHEIASRFERRGLPTHADQIMVTDGALHGLTLVAQALAGAGDRVLTELPTYPGLIDGIPRTGARIVPVPMKASGGWDVAAVGTTMRQTTPSVAFLMPDFQNPTGALMSAAERREITRAAKRTGTIIVVDEAFVELGFSDPQPPMASFDRTVVTVGALSKPVWGGLRIGWVRGSADLIRRLAAARAASNMAGSVLDQLVGVGLFERLDIIAAQRRAELATQRDALLSALRRALPSWRAPEPAGGMSVWAEFDGPYSTALTSLATQHGVLLAAGSRFGVAGTLERFIRIPYALPAADLQEAVSRLARAWAQVGQRERALAPLVVA